MDVEASSLTNDINKTSETVANINKLEEQKLLSKYPGLVKNKGAALIHNRLNANSRQYFDSGDYNMQKTRIAPLQPQVPQPQPVILNPEVVLNCRKRSVCTTHPHQFSHPTHSIHEKIVNQSGLSIEPIHEKSDSHSTS